VRYRVQPGDTLCLLSQRFGVSLDDILAANSLTDPDMIMVGQEIIIPQTGLPDPRIDTEKIIQLRGVTIHDDAGLQALGDDAEADFRLMPSENDNPWVRVFVSFHCRLHYHVSAIDIVIKENNVICLYFLPESATNSPSLETMANEIFIGRESVGDPLEKKALVILLE
jgi:LysM repeat protein